MSRNLAHPDQTELFRSEQLSPVFESRRASECIDIERFRSRMKRAMSSAIRACGKDRDALVEEMDRISSGQGPSRSMLDAYTAEAKEHDISLVRFKLFVRATGVSGLWDTALSDDGLIVLQGDEARLAEIARLQQAQREIGRQLKALKSVPVQIRSRA